MMKRIHVAVLPALTISIFATLLLTSCGSKKTILEGFTQGTTYKIVVVSDKKQDLKREVDSLLTVVDNSMSLYNTHSLISRINRNETNLLDSLLIECITAALEISEQSDGVYDITIKPLTSAYGFTGDKTIEQPNVDSLLKIIGYKKISINNGQLIKENPQIQIDLNSIAQGATSDYIARYFDGKGFENYLVEVGGEIYARGLNLKGKSWVVGIDKPEEGNLTPGANLQVKISLSNEGLATSGNYRKFYTDKSGRKIVHTVNPVTGQPVISNLLSATVVAKNSTLADAYGTMFMVMGLEQSIRFLEQHDELAAYLIYSDQGGNLKVYATSNLESKIIK